MDQEVIEEIDPINNDDIVVGQDVKDLMKKIENYDMYDYLYILKLIMN